MKTLGPGQNWADVPTMGHITGTREQVPDLQSYQETVNILFLLRDPRDVETSMRIYSEGVVPGHFDAEADAILEDLGWFRWYLSVRDHVKATTIRYESLWYEPIRTLYLALDALGIKRPDGESMHEILTRESFGVRSGGRDRGEEDIASHLRKGIVGDWVNHWSAEKRGQFETKFAVQLADLGYPLGGLWFGTSR
jgi:hypothetical protein